MTRNATGFHEQWNFDPLRDMIEFHRKFQLEYIGPPRQLPADIEEFRAKFLREEADEYSEIVAKSPLSRGQDDNAKQLDALVDIVYVALGTAYLHGYDFAEAWQRVHAANMAKVRAVDQSESKRGSTFDVIKPAGWVAPDLTDLV